MDDELVFKSGMTDEEKARMAELEREVAQLDTRVTLLTLALREMNEAVGGLIHAMDLHNVEEHGKNTVL